jgi:hypothetical protein
MHSCQAATLSTAHTAAPHAFSDAPSRPAARTRPKSASQSARAWNTPTVTWQRATTGDSCSLKRPHLGDWQISLAASETTATIYDQLRANGGFCITNVGVAQRAGSPASAREVYRLLDELALLFSLTRGGWACPFLPVSFARAGARIWEEWALRNVDTWKGHFSWFPPFHPDALGAIAMGLHSRELNLSSWIPPVRKVYNSKQ